MQKEIIYTKSAPEPIGPYSQAIGITSDSSKLIYTSGQIAIDPATNEFTGGNIKEQSRKVLDNLTSILNSSGSDLKRVIKTTVFLKHMTDFTEMNEIYSEYFGESKPARSTVAVNRLPKDALVEIEAIAYI
jgi:2-iminobutanoate/2-iminopropanoate deaminase